VDSLLVSSQVRAAAAIALGQLGEVAVPALPALLRALRLHTVSRDVVAAVMAQLGEEAEMLLRKCVHDAHLGVSVRVSAAKGLTCVPTQALHCCKRADAIARAVCRGVLAPTPKLRSACLKVSLVARIALSSLPSLDPLSYVCRWLRA
jgi:hypothetical protein